MTSVHSATRSYRTDSRISNPFDSDDEQAPSALSYASSTASSARSSSGVSDVSARKSRSQQSKRGASASNPFDDNENLTKMSNGQQSTSRNSSVSISSDPTNPFGYAETTSAVYKSKTRNRGDGNEIRNPFDEAEEVTSKPITQYSASQSVLDNGSLFDDEEQPAKPSKGPSSFHGFTQKLKESGSKIKDSSLNLVKLPQRQSSTSSDEKSVSKGRKSKQQARDLFGDVEPTYKMTNLGGGNQNYFSQSADQKFSGQTVEELERYAVARSQDTSASIKNCIKVAEDTRGVASQTLEMLHEQAEQIRRTHESALHVDEELGRGEKLLGSLGGIFSRTWKPKKSRQITGPLSTGELPRRKFDSEGREELGLNGDSTKGRADYAGLSAAQVQLEMEKAKQDEDLNDLSNVMGHLKEMTIDMGNEISRQNDALEHMHDDVQELNFRVKGANNRTRHLLGR